MSVGCERECTSRIVTAACWNSFNDLDVKIGIRCQVYGRCWIYERCRAYRRATEVVESTDVAESTNVKSTDVIEFTDVSGSWVDVEPAGTREVHRGSCGAWWCRERSLTTQFDWWCRERLFDSARDQPVAREDRNLVPVCPSTRRTLGRVDSHFVWEFVYRVACRRDRRPTFLKDFLKAYNCFLLFVCFCNFRNNFDFCKIFPPSNFRCLFI